MAQNPLLQVIEQTGREKGIDREILVRALEEAYAAASRKVLRTHENIVSEFDDTSGEFRIFAKKRVVAEVEDPDTEISLDEAIEIDAAADFDQELRFPRTAPEMGRIAAQTAKQVIYQKIKEAEREKIYNEYIDRVGELINGIVKRIERGDIIIDLGTTEGIIPRKEVSRVEHHCGPLGHRLHDGHQVSVHLRFQIHVAQAGVTADDDERRMPPLCLVQRAHGVADAG